MNLLSLRNISKAFYGVPVLEDISLDIVQGDIHGIVGENGAGKSTLMNIISGLVRQDTGEIYFENKKMVLSHPRDAEVLGVVHIHQELNVVPYLSIVENLFLGKELHTCGVLQHARMNAIAVDTMKKLKQHIDVRTPMKDISIGHQQIVEIAKALLHNTVKLIILDEPTSSLTDKETVILFDIIRQLQQSKKVSFMYISHRLSELFTICDRVTVLRDGALVDTSAIAHTHIEDVASKMLGKKMNGQYRMLSRNTPSLTDTKEVMRVENLSKYKKFSHIHFNLYEGEILGFFGLIGAGRTDLINALYGISAADSGKIFLYGKEYRYPTPYRSIQQHIGYLSENRSTEGIFANLDTGTNIVINSYNTLSRYGVISLKKESRVIQKLIHALSIKVSHSTRSILTLSGGNQQKALLARNLAHPLKILILDEPTRGIDIGAKREVYKIMKELTERGIAVLMVSSELDEVLHIADRVAIMCEGVLTATIPVKNAHQEMIMKYATNVHEEVNVL